MKQEVQRQRLNENFEKLRQRFGGKCWDCSSEYNLQFAHVNDTGLKGSGRGKKKDITISLTIYSVTNFSVKLVIESLIVREGKDMITLTKDTMILRGKSW